MKRTPSIAISLCALGCMLLVLQALIIVWIMSASYNDAGREQAAETGSNLDRQVSRLVGNKMRGIGGIVTRILPALTGAGRSIISKQAFDRAMRMISPESPVVAAAILKMGGDGYLNIMQFTGAAETRGLIDRSFAAQAMKRAPGEITLGLMRGLEGREPRNLAAGIDRAIDSDQLFALAASKIISEDSEDLILVVITSLNQERNFAARHQACIVATCNIAIDLGNSAKANLIETLHDSSWASIHTRTPVAGTDLAIDTTLHIPPLTAHIRDYNERILIVVIGGPVLIAAGFWFAIARFIKLPLERFSDALRRIARQPNLRLPKAHFAEFRELFAAFNAMGLEIQEIQTDLVQAASRWHRLIEGNTANFILVDADTAIIRSVNRAACHFYGREPSSLVGMNFWDLCAPRPEKTISLHEPATHRISQQAWDRIHPVDISLGPAMINGETVTMIVVKDAKAEVEALMEAARAERARVETLEAHVSHLSDIISRERTLRSSISHEIRNPLATIFAAAENAVMMFDRNPEKAKSKITTIRNSADRINQLVERGLKVYASESMGLSETAQKTREDLFQHLEKWCKAWQESDSRHFYVVSLPKQPAIGRFDKILIQSVIDNIIHNAQKYSHQDTSIMIAAQVYGTDAGRQAIITISDNGIGMPDDFLPHAGTKKMRARNAAELPGTGQGLHLCKQILHIHGGDLKISSRLGEGTKVTISLPLDLDGLARHLSSAPSLNEMPKERKEASR